MPPRVGSGGSSGSGGAAPAAARGNRRQGGGGRRVSAARSATAGMACRRAGRDAARRAAPRGRSRGCAAAAGRRARALPSPPLRAAAPGAGAGGWGRALPQRVAQRVDADLRRAARSIGFCRPGPACTACSNGPRSAHAGRRVEEADERAGVDRPEEERAAGRAAPRARRERSYLCGACGFLRGARGATREWEAAADELVPDPGQQHCASPPLGAR